MRQISTILLLSLLFLTSALRAEELLKFSDFAGVYYVKSCTLEVNLVQQPPDPFCDLAMIVVTQETEEKFTLSYIAKSGGIVFEETIKAFNISKDPIEDVAEFKGDAEKTQWFRRYKDVKDNTFIDEMRQFSASAEGEPYVHFVSAIGRVHDLDYKFARYDYELERLKPE